MREPGAILLVSCYELGHQPAALAFPMAFLERTGFAPDALDLAVEALDEAKVRRARLVAIAVPMHTALRIGVHAADRIRALNSAATICFIGLYAVLNRDYLLERCADAVLGGELEEQHAGEPAEVTFERVRAAAHRAAGRRPPEASATHAERRPVPPRLTEPWFC